MASKPFAKKVTLLQYKHSIPSMKQDALDESPRGFTDWRIHALLKGTITQIQPPVWKNEKKKIKAIDPYFVIGFDGTDVEEWNVHCIVNEDIKAGFKSKEGGYIGDIAEKNPSGVASHRHHFLRSKKTKLPIDVFDFYIKHGIYPNDWILDPMKLIPKGKYVMSKPKPPVVTPPVPPVVVDPKDKAIADLKDEVKGLKDTLKIKEGNITQLTKDASDDSILISKLTSERNNFETLYHNAVEELNKQKEKVGVLDSLTKWLKDILGK